MKVLIACEESQRVCQAFREKGHLAFSCDIIECSGGHPEWHIKQDVLPLLNGNCSFTTCDGITHTITERWDMIIAFPPCINLCSTGASTFKQKREDGRQEKSIIFFATIMNADCEKIVIENPVGIISGKYIKEHFPHLCEKYGLPKKATQIIQPWMFGDKYQKTTCLWLKGVKPLAPAITVKPQLEFYEWTDSKTGKIKRQPLWYYEAAKTNKKEKSKIRSKTFPGIAAAMAAQWG